jgi:hypothetical protein
VSRAIVVWTGYGQCSKPTRDEARLVDEFGEEAALDVLPIVRQLETDFYTSTAYNTVLGLHAMAERAASEFKGRHPELLDVAAAAFAWCYAYDWK